MVASYFTIKKIVINVILKKHFESQIQLLIFKIFKFIEGLYKII